MLAQVLNVGKFSTQIITASSYLTRFGIFLTLHIFLAMGFYESWKILLSIHIEVACWLDREVQAKVLHMLAWMRIRHGIW